MEQDLLHLSILVRIGKIRPQNISANSNVYFYFDDKHSTKTCLSNARNCGFADQASAVCAKAEEVLSQPNKFGLVHPFDIVSVTPPYEEIIYSDLIDSICNSTLVAEDTIVIIEYPVEMGTLPNVLGGDKLFGIRNRRYGRTVIALYVFRPNKKYPMKPDEFL